MHVGLTVGARSAALFLGLFGVLNGLGELLRPGFDATIWWLDVRPFGVLGALVSGVGSACLAGYGLLPRMGRLRRTITLGAAACLLLIAICDVVRFYVLLASGGVHGAFAVPLSLLVALALGAVLLDVVGDRPGRGGRLESAFCAAGLAAFLVVFPLAQMLCFGKTDYRRPADAIVVFGARAYRDGRPSDALADRVRTACDLYHDGYASRLIFSGGPGDGEITEPEAMRRFACSLGVPSEAVILDEQGVNTDATVRNTCGLFRALGLRRVLAVSHFYHLPRVKMCYRRHGVVVYTVPARESYVLTKMPYLIAREVAALWFYYLGPLAP